MFNACLSASSLLVKYLRNLFQPLGPIHFIRCYQGVFSEARTDEGERRERGEESRELVRRDVDALVFLAGSLTARPTRVILDVGSQPVFAQNLRAGLEACGVEVRDCGRWGRKDVADRESINMVSPFTTL